MPLSVPEIAYLRTKDSRLADALDKIVREINLTQKATGVAPAGRLPAPSTIAGLTVTAANGIFDIAISDPEVEQPGTAYFVEYSISANFPSSQTHVSGPHSGRNVTLTLGNATYYFRAYSAYPGSTAVSPIIVYGGANPTGVPGGGTLAPPALSTGQGSGVSQVPGFGFGAPPNVIPGGSGRKTLV
jgi:hypothetical protein